MDESLLNEGLLIARTIARRRALNHDGCREDDLFSEAQYRVMRSLEKYKEDGRASHYFTVVVNNAINDVLTKYGPAKHPATSEVPQHATSDLTFRPTLEGTPADVGKLSQRQKDVARCAALGMSIKETAEALHIATKTVACHRSSINRILGTRRAQEVAVAMWKSGDLDNTEWEAIRRRLDALEAAVSNIMRKCMRLEIARERFSGLQALAKAGTIRQSTGG